MLLLLQVKTTNPRKYSVRPKIGVVLPMSTCDIKGFVLYLLYSLMHTKHREMLNKHDFFFLLQIITFL